MPRLVALRAVTMSLSLALLAHPAQAEGTGAEARVLKRQPTVVETTDLRDIVGEIDRLRAGQNDRRTLVVFDIDNTLLTMPQFLGSDGWFNLHSGLVATGADPDFDGMADLVAAQEALFNVGTMRPTQPMLQDLVKEMARPGVDIYLMSARGPGLYDATRRELDRNGVAFQPPVACSFVICELAGAYSAEEVRSALVALGLQIPDTTTFRPVLMRDGLMLVAGQNKGLMLHLLLGALASTPYDHVIFVDDSVRNVGEVAHSGVAPSLSVHHYVRIRTAVKETEKQAARSQWGAIRAALCAAVESDLCAGQRSKFRAQER